MDGHGEQYDRAASEAPKQVPQQLALVAPTLKEIERLLEQPGRAEAAMARYEQFASGRLPVTVLDSRADGRDDR